MSSAEANTIAIRQIEAEPAPTRFARGWHCLEPSRDFRDGNPHPVRAFGKMLVGFGDSDGKLNVLHGYCRRMGET
jgi:3-ketosteroid 9alpha-monooxygenase subunit A